MRLEEIAKQEAALLEARSAPLRRYLMDNVIPTLTQGLMEVSKVKPKDPVDYLVQWMLQMVLNGCFGECTWFVGGVPVQERSEGARITKLLTPDPRVARRDAKPMQTSILRLYSLIPAVILAVSTG
jgi:Dpy-30 motif